MTNGDRNGDGSATDADIAVILAAVDFPATRDDLVEAAQDADADETVVILFQDLPDQTFETRDEANTAVNERRRAGGSDAGT